MPSDADKKIIGERLDRFVKMADLRARKQRAFGTRRDTQTGESTRNLIEFIDDSEKRFMGYVPPRTDVMDEWQARVFVNLTRDIVTSWLAQAALSGVKMKFSATDKKGRADFMRTHIIQNLHDDSRKSSEERFTQFVISMEGVVKGTGIAYEGYRDERRDIKEILSYDPATGEVKTKSVEKRKAQCVRERVPIDEMYFGNPRQPMISKQPDMVWKSITSMDEAAADFSKFPKWSQVKENNGQYWRGFDEQPFYREGLFEMLTPDTCETVRYYNRREDIYSVIANGILLYDGPLPFHHKEYPFEVFRFENNLDLIYGNSLPNKFAHNQDIVNALWNMGLDRMILNLQRPIMTDDDEVIDTVWAPHSILKVGDIESWKEMTVDPPDASYFSMLQLSQKFVQENSGIEGGGGALTPRGGKITARQALLVEEEARKIMGLSLNNLEEFEAGCSKLRAQNILQFYALPDIQEVVGKEGAADYKKLIVDRSFQIKDTDLSDGTKGNLEIRVIDEDNLPTEEDIDVDEDIALLQGENKEILAVTPDYIRNMGIDVHAVPGSSFEKSETIEQALAREFYLDMQANPLANQEVNLREYVESKGKDADKFIAPPAQQNPGQTERADSGAAGGAPTISQQAGGQPTSGLGDIF